MTARLLPTLAVVPDAAVRPRVLPGLWFPLAVFGIWRVLQAVAVWAFGGDPVQAVYRWDGGWYRWILEHGYAFRPDRGAEQPSAFFPLVPWAVRGVRAVVRSQLVAVHVVANAAAGAAFCAVWGAVREWRDERVARRAVLALALFPTSLFLWCFYSEAAFVALSAGALWAATRRRPVLCGVLCAAGAMSRVPGVLVVPVAAWTYVQAGGRRPRAAWCALGLLGLVPVLVAQGVQAGDPFAFVGAGAAWGRHLAPPWEVFRTGLDFILNGSGGYRVVTAADLVAALTFVGVGLWMFRRWAAPAGAWPLLMVAVPLFTATSVSLARYVLAAWPAFGAAGDLPPWARRAGAGVLAILSVVVLREFAKGGFVG